MRRQSQGAWAGLVLLALVAAAIWLWWPVAAPGALSAETATPDEVVGTPAPEPPPAATASPESGATSLPPDDAPLADILAPLTARAAAGDRRAACRLAVELLRCDQLRELESLPKPPREVPAEQPTPESHDWNDYLVRQQAWTRERLQQCEAVPDALRGQGSRYLEQAALAGDPESMVRYADGLGWSPSGRGHMAGDDFDRWRRQAPAMVQRALESGYPGAVFLQMLGYSDDSSPYAALVPDDPEQALVMSLLYSRLLGANGMTRFQNRVDAAAQIRARQRAEALHDRYFNGRRYSRSNSWLFALPATVAPQPGQPRLGYCLDP